ncbi:MAG: alpha/beta fold hydrolase, partial [Pseudomonadales bacterium]
LYQEVPVHERIQTFVDSTRASAGRSPRRYASLEEAFQRMRSENKHLSEAQARHLTVHGSNQNEDGSYSWKFDNQTHVMAPFDLTLEQSHALWARISAPLLLMSGSESEFGRFQQGDPARHFANARSLVFEQAGHWIQHDQLDRFISEVRAFFGEDR